MAKSLDFSAIILAAGKGTRMNSPLPKVLHPVAGWPMLLSTLSSVQEAGANQVRVVVGYGENLVRQVVEPKGALCFKQDQQLGTGHAVMCAEPSTMKGVVMILNGDHPLLTSEDVQNLIKEFRGRQLDLAVVSAKVKTPGSLGRIVRHNNQLKAIVEAKDASHETLKINEINTGIYLVDAEILSEMLPKIKTSNAQNEYYLTDIIELALNADYSVDTILTSARAAFGVNTQQELARATEYIFKQMTKKLMDSGVVIVDPKTTYIERDVKVEPGAIIYPGCFLRNQSKIGAYSVIEPNCYIEKSELGEGVHLRMGSYLEDTKIQEKSIVGPYARLRPGTKIGKEAQVGNFVEMKKVDFGNRAKAGHLTYLGDAIIGEGTNIGCGTITCNYAVDKKKYVTKIGKDVFVGSDTQFIAPIEVGDGAIIASGSTVTKNVPPKALAVARGRQFIKENYKPLAKDSKKPKTSDSQP